MPRSVVRPGNWTPLRTTRASGLFAGVDPQPAKHAVNRLPREPGTLSGAGDDAVRGLEVLEEVRLLEALQHPVFGLVVRQREQLAGGFLAKARSGGLVFFDGLSQRAGDGAGAEVGERGEPLEHVAQLADI